ncbi:MAG: polyribonucleotide nucleotidyltransferase [Saprospiraceae bacterium]|jgi:polyribonucleotide nucleotidyltransferase
MGKQIPITQSFNLPDGQEVIIETGKLATQADGSVVVRIGDTMIFASIVSATKPKPGQSFFPLSVDYQEKFAAVGRIPGNFFRRETRLNDYEVLISRLVDRALRPLFPSGYMHETQVILNLISGDAETLPDAYACLAASAALAVSPILVDAMVSEARVARINGKFHINPAKSDLEMADLNIILAATDKDVMMVEGDMDECQEAELIEAIKFGHEAIKTQIQALRELAEKVGDYATVKREWSPAPIDEDLYAEVEKHSKEAILVVARGKHDKVGRKKGLKEAKTALKEALLAAHDEEWMDANKDNISSYFDKIKKKTIRTMMLAEQTRLDGRDFDKVRPIWTEVDYLPSAHGSAIFNRGETQALTSLTLGTKLDKQMIDNALGKYTETFILHYNFPAYSVGEIKMMRGPGRREVGHANLAARSLKKVLPDDQAYTIRLVADIMESNGSSSMATVCSGCMALMDGGIKVKNTIAGIAMGMIAEGDEFAILTDILGDEDALGDMDFKVTGTKNGITACQMDIKIDGLPYENLEKALAQARDGRLHIIDEMEKTMAEPREDYKPHAPRIVEVIIDKSYIGAIIGPGGKIIQEMQEVTGATINIEEKDGKGHISVSSSNKASIDDALARINDITFTPSVGEEYDAIVKTIMPYGVFVDFKGKSGLLHVSEISYTRIENVEEIFQEGDMVRVKLVEIDERSGKMRLSRKALLEKPEGYVDPPARERREGGGGGDRRGGGRGGDRGGDRRGGGGYGGGRR